MSGHFEEHAMTHARMEQMLPEDPNAAMALVQSFSQKVMHKSLAAKDMEINSVKQAMQQHAAQMEVLKKQNALLAEQNAEFMEKRDEVSSDIERLTSEKMALIETVKRLNRELAKLEAFKRSVLQTVNEDDEGLNQFNQAISAVDLTSERMVNEVLAAAQSTPAMSTAIARDVAASLSGGMGGMRAGMSTGGGAAPGTSASFGQSPMGSPSKVDGKEFFRQARARLNYESFAQFLQNIKELNGGRQTREETLRRARDIFGPQNADLYQLFEGLLSRHLQM